MNTPNKLTIVRMAMSPVFLFFLLMPAIPIISDYCGGVCPGLADRHDRRKAGAA